MSTKKTSSEKQNESKVKPLEIRRLTVSGVIVNEGYRKDDYASRILLFGKWVRKCGFEAQDKLTVWIYEKRIVIEKEVPGLIDTKLLARVQDESSRMLRKKIKEMVHPEIFEQLKFINGEIKVKEEGESY
ncbi:type I toxin-antitoxin system SymE family toxin [Elizabethkingia ursingii]|uniref:type I toxin-antitoxin system SymE family toxin n=1 Tax=Elizabethkingia ursingii TaxID=1756150 RepID=UPI002010C8DB|nr:type I toxin-antitoxin system SymE family toxin [Elizabethkingia ursingii]MCL1665121.1 type I toxin-antitoxin system SymE family toxin [Elizabethkingia ursingii]